MNESESLSQLSRREIDCLALVYLGKQSKEMAPILGIEPGSIDVNLKRAGRKVGIGDRRRLAALLSQQRPDLLQSALQRLGQDEKSLVSNGFDVRGGGADLAKDDEQTPARWPVPTKDRPRNDLPNWMRRGWAAAIAIGVVVAALLLLATARMLLTNAPRPQDLGLTMRKTIIETTKVLSQQLRASERSVDEGIIAHAHILATLLQTRIDLNLGADAERDLVNQTWAAMGDLVTHRERVIGIHSHASELARRVGVDPSAIGDEGPTVGRGLSPLTQPDLTIVRNAA